MSVHYLQRQSTKGVNDTFSGILKNCQEEFAAQSVNVFGAGFEDILKEDSYFNHYVELLSEGLDDEDAANFKILADNGRKVALEAAPVGTVAPWSSLNTPMIRKSWAKLAMPKALPTEAVESPKFTITYMTPWVKNVATGKKCRVPEDLMDFDEAVSKLMPMKNTPVYFTSTGMAGGTAQNFISFNLKSGKLCDAMGNETSDQITLDPADAKVAELIKDNDMLDVKMAISKVAFTVDAVKSGASVEYNGQMVELEADAKAPGATSAYTAEDLVKATNIQLMTRTNTFKALVRLEIDVDAECVGGTAGETARVAVFDTLFGDVDLMSFRCTLSCVGGKIAWAQMKAAVSSMMNNYNTEVGFDIDDKEINIGTGDHISCPVPNEYVTDLLRMYQFNGVTKLVDIMSNTIAQKLDLDAIAFIDEEIAEWLDQMQGRFVQKFSVKPVGSFVGSPSEWKKEIRDLIDFVADDILNFTHLDTGYFVLLGNPLDTHILPEINWVFQGGANRENAGVAANYSFGTLNGIHSYNIVSSPNVRQGFLRLYFIPTVEDQMTMKFFPYSMVIEQPGTGYNNPNAQLVPSIMSHRRYTFESVLRSHGKIVITNNDYTHRSLAGQSPYLPTQTEI